MQYKIEGSEKQIQDLATHVFNEYPYQIKNRQLHVLTDCDETTSFLSMVSAFTKCSVMIDYMTQEIVKFTIL